jgi:hypothetical protein
VRTRGTTESHPRPLLTTIPLVALLVCLAFATTLGCSGSATTSTGASGITASSQNDTTTVRESAETTTSAGLAADPAYDQPLTTTALAVRDLSAFLQSQNVSENDPRIGLLYGLRAREQAITARKALSQKVTSIADSAMQDVYSTVSRGKSLATGTVLATLEQAYKTIEDLGQPSAAPEESASLLDKFIAELDPLIAQANALVSSSTTSFSSAGPS